ncbi:MAG: tetratricopeptide repeat protein [Acidobacteria bacterium]|nr:tetratricopeptide repeat protein [Acidobacteriota bacterium]
MKRSAGDETPSRDWLPFALLLLVAVLPRLFTLGAPWLWDDTALIANANAFDEVSEIPGAWTSELWYDGRPGSPLYRPVPRTLWILQHALGGGSPIPFRLVSILLHAGVVVLLFAYLQTHVRRKTALIASLLFAVFPVHTEVIVQAASQSELLAAGFGLASLLFWKRSRPAAALLFFALAVLSKESAAAIAVLGWLETPSPKRRMIPAGLAVLAIVACATWARLSVDAGSTEIPALDNPASLLPHFPRILTALWVQCLYLWKTLIPLNLAADYSYREIPLVMSLGDLRALAGLGLAIGSAVLIVKRSRGWKGVLAWWVLFLPASNLLFPIGTIMGERLAFFPSAGLAYFLAVRVSGIRTSRLKPAMIIVVLVLASLSVVRYRDWSSGERFHEAFVEDAPNNAKAWSARGVWLAGDGRMEEAIASYDRSIELYPYDGTAHFNRANALVRLGRTQEAIDGYQRVVQLSPGQTDAKRLLRELLAR